MTVLPVRPGQLAASFAGALLLTVCLIGAAQAKDSLAASKFVTIPIYYVTDREQKGETFGNRRRYPSECQHHMYYGTAMVTVPNKDLKIIDDRLKALGWQAADHRGGKISPKEMIDSKHPLVGRMTFLHRLVEALDKESKVTTASSEGSVGHLEAATTAPRATPTTAEAATIAPRATATTPEVASAHESAAAHATIPRSRGRA
jgi:hypothetical protein